MKKPIKVTESHFKCCKSIKSLKVSTLKPSPPEQHVLKCLIVVSTHGRAFGKRFVLKSYQLCCVKVLISMQIAALHFPTHGLGIWEYIDMKCSLLRY